MAQAMTTLKPISVNTDMDEFSLKQDEARYLKNYRISFNQNAAGVNGGNFGVGTPVQSNVKAHSLLLPAGYNKNAGSFEAKEINKLFYWNYNSNGLHGLYMIDGDTMKPHIVLVDRLLNLSADPKNFIAEHRVSVHVVYEGDASDTANRKIKEIYLTWTEASNWQRWVNVMAAIGSSGFNETMFPYWKTFAPHFDRQAYIDHVPRHSMSAPTIATVEPTAADSGKHNNLIKKQLFFAYRDIYTDGRTTPLSQWSQPFSLNTQGCNINAVNLPRCLELTMDAGSALTERRQILFKNGELGDWYLYETINKFDTSGLNDPAKIGDEYWKRTGAWSKFQYNAEDNTIRYRYCGDKECGIFSQDDAKMYSSSAPIRSVAQASVGDSILLGDNLYGYPNFPSEIMDKFKLAVDKPVVTDSCAPKLVNIKLYSYIGRNAMTSQFAFKYATDSKDVYFGNAGWIPIKLSGIEQLTWAEQEATMFGLSLQQREGFICYLAGTPYYTVGKQYKVDGSGNKEYVGVIDWSRQDQKDMVHDLFEGGGYFVMQYEFNVPAGNYIARLARHDVKDTADFRSTSTYVMGIANSAAKNPARPFITESNIVSYAKEIEVMAGAGSVDVWGTGKDLFYVFAPIDYHEDDFAGVSNRRWRFIEGYVREDDKSNIGMELLGYYPNHGRENIITGHYTDHNGFYFAQTTRGEAKEAIVIFYGRFNCSGVDVEVCRNRDLPDKDRGYYPNQNIYIKEANNGKVGDSNRIIVRGKVTDCASGMGLSGVAVTLTRGMTTYTGTDGSFTLIAHNQYFDPTLGVTTDKIFYNVSGLCHFTSCDCGIAPVDAFDRMLTPCAIAGQRVYPTEFVQAFKVLAQNHKALKGGGRYGFGMVGHDLAGRPSFVNLIGYADIPTFMDTQAYAPSLVRWYATQQVKFPKDIKYISFFRTKNLNYQSYLQWVGDKIEFLNNDGKVINSGQEGAVRARIYIQSLNEFNIQNNFGTTAKYQFVSGDTVRIYDDGDGNLFDPAKTSGYLDYQVLGTNWDEANDATAVADTTTDATIDGKSFIIPFDSRLNALKEKKGFWIELMRPKDCTNKELYFEISGTYPVVNGEMQVMSGKLDTWDTYYQTRFFKIPEAEGKTFLHPFESSAVSDYWGANADSGGRTHVRDEKAEQKWYPDDVIKSDDLVNEGRVNGLGTFRSSNRKQFKGQGWGGIVAMNAERNIIAFVCENDWFLTDYQMNLVRATKDGFIAATLDGDLGNPHQKVGSNYGCAMEHTATVIFEDGIGVWGGAGEAGVIIMDYSKAEDIAAVDNKGYFTDKWNFVNKHNRSLPASVYLDHLIDVVAGYDPKYKEYLITFRPRRGRTTDISSFISDEREVKIDFQETFVFSFEQKKWVRWAGFAPESYGKLRHAATGQELISFSNGEPYLHNSKGVTTFNTFYGVKTSQVIDAVVAVEPKKVKVFQSVTVEGKEIKYFIDKAETSESESFSYVPPAYVKRKENVWYAELLRDMNTYPSMEKADEFRAMLLDGKRLFGQYLRIRLVRDLLRKDEYNEFNGVQVRMIGSEKSDK